MVEQECELRIKNSISFEFIKKTNYKHNKLNGVKLIFFFI